MENGSSKSEDAVVGEWAKIGDGVQKMGGWKMDHWNQRMQPPMNGQKFEYGGCNRINGKG
jgi:hypothetical protein